MKRDLNDMTLRNLKPPATGRLEIRDTEVVGLVLRVTHNGAMTWSVRTRTKDGKQTRPKLGTYPAMGIAAARKAARLAIGGILAGADPVEAKRQARDARRTRLAEATVADRLAEWQATRQASLEKPWSDRYAAEVARICTHDLIPRLGKRALVETTRSDWTALVAAKRKAAPAMAAALYRVVSSFLNHAEAEGWIAAPLLPRKGAAKLAPLPPARARVLTDSELAEVWRATEQENPKARAFVRLLILTAAREMEVADVATGEIDREAARWRIPGSRTKNGEGYAVPLLSLALAEVAAVWPPHDDEAGLDWRLLGKIRGSGYRGFSKLKARLDATVAAARAKDAAGGPVVTMPAWRWHDLRRTARTGMTRLGIPRDHAEAAINHVSGRSKLERTYDRHDYADEIVAALSRWQAHVAALVTAQPVAEVVPLAARWARRL
jgi:integrase